MTRTSRRSTGRALLAVTLPLALLAAVVLAGSASTSLPNGAELTVKILDPVTSTEFQVPVGEAAIDVEVTGKASVGLGEADATFVYVIDTSGSTSTGGGTGCSPILGCEKQFFVGLNNAVVADGSTDEVGIVRYGSSASIALGLVAPTHPAVVPTINGLSAGGMTNCTDALVKAKALVDASTNGSNNVVFASDGVCNYGGPITTARDALAATGAIVNTIAIGSGSSCTSGYTGTLAQIAANGGQCHLVPDPGNLPDLISSLIGSTLESLEIEVDGGGRQLIPGVALPQDGPVSVDYDTTVTGLAPGDHEICVTASGSDVTGGVAEVTRCETIHLLQLAATPATEVNDLNFDDQHTVTAEVFGGSGPDRDVDFLVGGHNAATASPPSGSILASVNVPVDFVYTVPQDCASLGLDTITVTTVIAGDPSAIDVTKEWIDTVPPAVSCDPSVNPHGNEPNAPGRGGQQNADGFYQLNAEDPYLANCTVTLLVFDGDGFVFPGCSSRATTSSTPSRMAGHKGSGRSAPTTARAGRCGGTSKATAT